MTFFREQTTLNLVTGVLRDDFFVPKNLKVGDQFYDSYQGNITITSIQQRTVTGTKVTVISGAKTYAKYYWDRTTDSLVAASSNKPSYTMVTQAIDTNI